MIGPFYFVLTHAILCTHPWCTTRHDAIVAFFKNQVDHNANLLTLCSHTYMCNNWVVTCAKIYVSIAETLIFPFMEMLGLDRFKAQREKRADWFEIKRFFVESKIPELKLQAKSLVASEEFIDQLHAAVIDEIIVGVERQLSKMVFFSMLEEEQDFDVLEKMKLAETDNLACESNFGWFDHATKMGCGNETVKSLSYKSTVRQNGALTDDEFLALSPEEKVDMWKFCKTSDEAKAVHALEESLVQDVKAAKTVAQETRKKLKLKQAKTLLDMMAKAIKYGGPLSVDNIDAILFKLDLTQTLNEVKLARATLDVTIRQKYLVIDGVGKKTFVNEPISKLKSSLRDAIKPSGAPKLSIEELLARAYRNAYANRRVGKLFGAEDGEDGAGVQCMHYGTVTDMYDPVVAPLYQIVHGDGDEETVYLHELEPMLLPEEQGQ